MNQRWWIAIVAVVGIGLAVLLFPRPDTGESIPGTNLTNTDPSSSKDDKTTGATVGKPRPPVDPDRVRTGVKPGMEHKASQRNRPEAVYASKLITPFSAIRFTLMKEGSEPAKALAEEIGVLLNEDLRKIRLDPDSVPWEAVEKRMDQAIAHVQASPFGKDTTIQKSLERYKQFVAEYHQAKSTEGAPPAEGASAAPAPEAAPATPAKE